MGYLPFSLPRRLVRQFGTVVQAFVLVVLDARHDLNLGRGIALQFVSDENPWRILQALESLTKEPFNCMAIAPALHDDVDCMAILIDSAPKVMMLALDREHDLVKMPFIATLRLTTAQLSSVLLAEPQRPLADRLVGDDDTPTGHEVFDVTKAQRNAEVEPDHVTDDLAGVAEAAVKLSVCHLRIFEKHDGLLQVDSTTNSADLCNKAERRENDSQDDDYDCDL